MKVFLKILMWVALIAVVVFVVLFLAVKISGNFSNIGELIDYLIDRYNAGDGAISAMQNMRVCLFGRLL